LLSDGGEEEQERLRVGADDVTQPRNVPTLLSDRGEEERERLRLEERKEGTLLQHVMRRLKMT
jgi:hypothetical protein